MKQAWTDLKSFVTVAMIVLLFAIVVANIFGVVLADDVLILVTNLITAIFTYYFTKKDETKEDEVEEVNENSNDE